MRALRLTLFLLLAANVFAQNSDRPKVRAITAFVRLTPSGMDGQLADALKFLQAAKAAYEKRGYEVESIRITTQPFPEIVRGMSQGEGLALLQKIDTWAQRNSVDPNIGPAMMKDSDSPDAVELLKQVLTKTKVLEGSVIVADKDGIHWKSIHPATRRHYR